MCIRDSKKTPNEIALEIFLVALSIVFILVTLALYCYSCYSVGLNDMDNPTAVTLSLIHI